MGNRDAMEEDVMVGMFEQGGKTFKFNQAGDAVSGIIRDWREEQQHTFDRATNRPSDQLATYDDGNPIMQLVLTLGTDLREDEDDDGTRYVYVSGKRAKTAVRNAVRAAGAKVPEEGAKFTMTMTGTDPGSFNASAKAFSALYERPVRASQTFGVGQSAAVWQPVVQPQQAATALQGQVDPWGPANDAEQRLPAADVEKVRALIGMGVGLDDSQVAAATGVSAADVALLRAATPF